MSLMASMLKKMVREITPPVLLRAARSVLTGHGGAAERRDEERGEKDAHWYDRQFERDRYWTQHYARSPYYFLWTVIADRIARSRASSILEVGCGSGQLAALLRDKGVRTYHGLDFSAKRIAHARKLSPSFGFSVADALETDLFDTVDYDMVLSTEFLEHVEGDTVVIQKIRSGTKFVGTVPDFPSKAHVRHFRDTDEVMARYGTYFDGLRVDDFVSGNGATFF